MLASRHRLLPNCQIPKPHGCLFFGDPSKLAGVLGDFPLKPQKGGTLKTTHTEVNRSASGCLLSGEWKNWVSQQSLGMKFKILLKPVLGFRVARSFVGPTVRNVFRWFAVGSALT